MANLTFVSLFESEQEQLKSALQGCSLPKDAQKLQTIVAQYMSKLFDSDGELRMNLTQSEDYILQAAISLLNAQQQMATTMSDSMSSTMKSAPDATISNRNNTIGMAAVSGSASIPMSLMSRKISAPSAIGGSALGGIGGGLLFGTWGAVFGAVAGTALVLYISATTSERSTKNENPHSPQLLSPIESKINVEQYLSIIRNICQSLDSMIETFRAQIRRVVDKYESLPAPTLEGDYHDLLESIQSLLGAFESESNNPNVSPRIHRQKDELLATLESFNISVVNFDGTNRNFFSMMSSPNVTETTMVFPAFVKEGKVVLKGRIFTPQS